MPTLCHCGRPLHYEDKRLEEMVSELTARLGEYVRVTTLDCRTWLVQRHYIALHGIKEQEIAGLGFEEVVKSPEAK